MKGMIFCDFLTMVNDVFSPEIVENIIDASELPNQGAYTEIGTYDHQELIRLVSNLSIATNLSVPKLQIIYGKYLFKKLYDRYPDLMLNTQNSFEFLQTVDEHIHVEVLKLYPEAEVPKFKCRMKTPSKMTMEYHSIHPFADLAEGLILGCAEHFKESITVHRDQLRPKDGKKHSVLFTLSKQD